MKAGKYRRGLKEDSLEIRQRIPAHAYVGLSHYTSGKASTVSLTYRPSSSWPVSEAQHHVITKSATR